MSMKWTVVFAVLLAPAVVSANPSKVKEAREAAAFYLALAKTCSTVLGDPRLVPDAEEDTRTTLAAAGAPGEADLIIHEARRLDAANTTMPAPVCSALIANIKASRPAFRAKLSSP